MLRHTFDDPAHADLCFEVPAAYGGVESGGRAQGSARVCGVRLEGRE